MQIILHGLGGVATLMLTSIAMAQSNFPAKPVTMVLPFAAGGPVDVEARRHAAKLTEFLGQSFLVDFKPGGGDIIATNYVAKSAPDGYTLMVAGSSHTANPYLYKDLPYDSQKDFAPVSLVSKRGSILLSNLSTLGNNMMELIAYARANPGKVNWSAVGPLSQLNARWFAASAGVELTVVNYKSTPQALTDLMAGRLDVGTFTELIALPLVKAGKVKALGMMAAQRSRIFPGVLPIAEQGVPGYDANNWFGILARAGTPAAVVNRLSEGFAKSARSPDVIAALEAGGVITVGSTPEQLRQMMAEESERWRMLIQTYNIKVEE